VNDKAKLTSLNKLISKVSNAIFASEEPWCKEEETVQRRRGANYQGGTDKGELKTKVEGTEVNLPKRSLAKKGQCLQQVST
jgi:hypothetical protein